MANIHLIGGEKGGVGKSLVSRLLAQFMIDRSIPFLGFDSDRSHGALLRFYEGYASPVVIDNHHRHPAGSGEILNIPYIPVNTTVSRPIRTCFIRCHPKN